MSATIGLEDQGASTRSPGRAHGLFADTTPPSRQLLLDWLDQNGAYIHPSLQITEMEDGPGWRLTSKDNMEAFDLLFSIPKPSLLSTRTSSLPPLTLSDGPITNISIFHLALCLLHECRLGQLSPFYGYVQSLPRDTTECLLPIFWHLTELAGEDGPKGLRWLKGSEVERRMQSKAAEGLGYDDLVKFYTATSAHLPSTSTHPSPSPLLAFIHTYTLILTRAFTIDLYRPTALVPFADILNHSSDPHTSLASDDFVCHQCGSMGRCIHDILDHEGLPYRLNGTSLSKPQKFKMAGMRSEEDDTVELRAEREVKCGEEVWNSYGEIGDAGLLAEWGFLGGEYAGEGLLWRAEEVDTKGTASLEIWGRVIGVYAGETGSQAVDSDLENLWAGEGDEEDDGQGLISPPSSDTVGRSKLNLSLSGQLSFSLFLLVYLAADPPEADDPPTDILHDAKEAAEEIERAYAAVEERLSAEDATPANAESPADPPAKALSSSALECVHGVLDLLRRRTKAMYRSDLSSDEVLHLRDNLPPTSKYTRMAMTLTADERSLLATTIRRWEDLV